MLDWFEMENWYIVQRYNVRRPFLHGREARSSLQDDAHEFCNAEDNLFFYVNNSARVSISTAEIFNFAS